MNHEKAAFFDEQARRPWAAADYGRDERPKIDRILRGAELVRGQRVLEPGCGTGRLTALLADVVGPEGRVVALDISPAMISACAARTGHLTQVEPRRCSLEWLDWPGGLFDAVVCHQVFPHFDDHGLALARIAGLLRPGGVLVIAQFVSLDDINRTHREVGGPVREDMMPSTWRMLQLISGAGLVLEAQHDDRLGYFLKARLPLDAADGHTGP